jgi:hypothetical protein
LSEKKYDTAFITIANASAIFIPVGPARAPPAITKSTLNRISRMPVRRIFMKSPQFHPRYNPAQEKSTQSQHALGWPPPTKIAGES